VFARSRIEDQTVKSSRQFGIRAKLFLAFAAVSGTTVVAGGAAWLMFSQVRDLFHGVAGRNIPEIVETLGLQTDTQALAGSAPTLLAAKTQAQRQQEMAALKARQDGIAKRLDSVAHTQSDRDAIDRLKKLISAMNAKLAALDGAVDDRLKLSARGEEIVKTAQATQTKLNEVLLPAGEKAQADITMVSMTIGGDANQSMMTLLKLVSTQVPVSQGFADLVGFVNLASSLLDRAAVAPNVDSVAALEKSFKTMSAKVEEKLDIVDTLQPTEGMRKAADAWLKLGSGDTIFDARRKEIAASQLGQKLLDETRSLTDELAGEVAGQVKTVTNKAREATDRSDEAIGFGTFVMLMIAAFSVIGSALFVWFYIGRNLVARLMGLDSTMTRLAAGDLSADVGARRGDDEIGQMAEALSVFREGIVQANAAAAQKAAEQEAKQKQSALIDQLTREFNEGATSALAAVSTAASRMKGSAQKSRPAPLRRPPNRPPQTCRRWRSRPRSFQARSPRFPARSANPPGSRPRPWSRWQRAKSRSPNSPAPPTGSAKWSA
jgi:HAMP domain-containing protein